MATSRISNISLFDGHVVVTLDDGSTHEVGYACEWEDGLVDAMTDNNDIAALAEHAGLTIAQACEEVANYIEESLQRSMKADENGG